MNVAVLNVLCEGQTEERFVKEVLKPYLKDKGLIVKAQLLTTNKKKNVRGVMVTKNIGIDNLRRQCAHFDKWIEKLEGIA